MRFVYFLFFTVSIMAGGIAMLYADGDDTAPLKYSANNTPEVSVPLAVDPGPVPRNTDAKDTAMKAALDRNHMTPEEIWMHDCPVSDGFVFPVGPPDAKGYYDAQPFGGRRWHLGEDWNGRGGGDSDLGDPIYSVANGIVFFGEDIQLGWGNVVRILHNIGTKEKPVYIDSLYAHLDAVMVEVGDIVKRGEHIGTMGNCDGIYAAHLHFEMRDKAFMGIGGAYAVNQEGYINPTPFLKKHLVKETASAD